MGLINPLSIIHSSEISIRYPQQPLPQFSLGIWKSATLWDLVLGPKFFLSITIFLIKKARISFTRPSLCFMENAVWVPMHEFWLNLYSPSQWPKTTLNQGINCTILGNEFTYTSSDYWSDFSIMITFLSMDILNSVTSKSFSTHTTCNVCIAHLFLW